MPGEHLDLTSDPQPADRQASGLRNRRYIGVHFACCEIYSRIYVNREETAYTGYCPGCGCRVTLHIGPGGTDSRFFTVR